MMSFSEGSLVVFFAKKILDAASRPRMLSVESTGCKFKDWSERIFNLVEPIGDAELEHHRVGTV